METHRWHSRMSDVNPGGAASHGLSRAAANVSTSRAVGSWINSFGIIRESLSRGHWMLHVYGQSAWLLSEASTYYWRAYYWLHLHMMWYREKSTDGCCIYIVILWDIDLSLQVEMFGHAFISKRKMWPSFCRFVWIIHMVADSHRLNVPRRQSSVNTLHLML